MRDFLYAKTDTFPFAGMDNVGSNRLKDVGGDLHSYIVKNRPDLINKFSIENFENGMFDEVTRAWGDEYLVSLRGVRDAKNADEAAEFLTSSKGGGERVQGPGINTTGSLNQASQFSTGAEGYIGRIKVNEPYSSSANASTILDNIYNLEKEGGKLIPRQVSAGGVNYESLSRDGIVDGINTIEGSQVRLIKENTPVTLEDIIKTEGNDISNVLRNSSETTLDWTKNSRNDLNKLYNTILKTDYKQGGAIKGLVKKYGGGGSVGGWGAQGNFSTEYNSKQPKVAEIPDPNSIPEQNALDALVESGEEPLTEEEKKKQKNQKALQGAMKGASMGMSFGPWGAAIGAVAGGALAYFAKQGAKIRKLYKGGGEVSEGKPDVKDLLRTLAATSTKQFDTEPKKPQEDASTNEKLLSLLGSDNYSKEGFQKFREENDIYDEGAIDRVKTWNDLYYSNPDVLRRLTEQYQSTQDEFKGKTMGPHYTYDPPYSFDLTKEEEAVFDVEWKNYLEGIENGGYYKSGRLKPPPPAKYNAPPVDLAQALMDYRKKQVGNTHYEATEETWLDGDGKTYGRQDAGRKMDKINRGGGGRQARVIMGLPKDFQERINKVDMARYSPWYESATAHETSHSLDRVQGKTTGITEGEKKGQVDAIASNNLTLDSGNKRDSEYVLSDSELRARVGTLRYNLSKTGDDVFNELSMENIEAIKRSDPKGYKRLSLYLDDESIINLLNTQFKDGGKVKKYAADGIKVPEKEPDVKDLLHMLRGFGKEPRKPHGAWNMPADEEGWVPRHDDIYNYLASRDIDTKDDEIPKAYIIPGPKANMGYRDGYDAEAVSEKTILNNLFDPTKPFKTDWNMTDEFGDAPPQRNAKGQRIKVSSKQSKNPTVRIEEAIHSLQQQKFLDSSVSDSKIGGNKRRLYRMLKKQPWLDELSPDLKKTLTKGNYALKGGGSTSEFEAKLIAAKMTMINEGVLPKDGNVSDKDLDAIKQWYADRKEKMGETGWESVLFMDLSDKKYRDEMLSTLNKL